MTYLPGILLPQVLQVIPEHLPQEEEFVLLPLGIPPGSLHSCPLHTRERQPRSGWLSQCTVSDSISHTRTNMYTHADPMKGQSDCPQTQPTHNLHPTPHTLPRPRHTRHTTWRKDSRVNQSRMMFGQLTRIKLTPHSAASNVRSTQLFGVGRPQQTSTGFLSKA